MLQQATTSPTKYGKNFETPKHDRRPNVRYKTFTRAGDADTKLNNLKFQKVIFERVSLQHMTLTAAGSPQYAPSFIY